MQPCQTRKARQLYDNDLRHMKQEIGTFDGRPVSAWQGGPGEAGIFCQISMHQLLKISPSAFHWVSHSFVAHFLWQFPFSLFNECSAVVPPGHQKRVTGEILASAWLAYDADSAWLRRFSWSQSSARKMVCRQLLPSMLQCLHKLLHP